MPMPARPTPHFVLIEAALAFGGGKTLFDCPALARHRHYLCQRRPGRGEDSIIGPFLGVFYAPAHQQPTCPILVQAVGLHRCPLIPARSLAAGPGTQALPRVRRKLSGDDAGFVLLPAD